MKAEVHFNTAQESCFNQYKLYTFETGSKYVDNKRKI